MVLIFQIMYQILIPSYVNAKTSSIENTYVITSFLLFYFLPCIFLLCRRLKEEEEIMFDWAPHRGENF